MISTANVWGHLYLSLAAVAGLLILHNNLRAQSVDDPLNRRFIFGVRVTIAIFAGRALVVVTGGGILGGIIVSLAAALIPLAVLLLTEGLLRRHAPGWLKGFTAGGAVVFGTLGVIPPLWDWPYFSIGLMAFQALGLALCGVMVARRDRASLSRAENDTAARLALSLILIVPMIAADYAMVWLRMPVQMSALGVLVMCWLAVGLGTQGVDHRGVIIRFFLLSIVALGTGAFIGWINTPSRAAMILGAAIVMAGFLVVAIYFDARQQRTAGQSLSLLRHMAEGRGENALAFLTGLRGHPAVDGAVVITARELADFDAAVLDQVFARTPVLRRSDPVVTNPVQADQIAVLFARYAASHILQVSAAPRRLVALSMPALGLSAQVEYELQAVQRMATLIAAQDARDA